MILMLDEYGTVPWTTFADLAVPHISKNEPVGCRRVSQTDPLIFLSLYIDLHETRAPSGMAFLWHDGEFSRKNLSAYSLHNMLAKSVDHILERLVETSLAIRLAKLIATAQTMIMGRICRERKKR